MIQFGFEIPISICEGKHCTVKRSKIDGKEDCSLIVEREFVGGEGVLVIYNKARLNIAEQSL